MKKTFSYLLLFFLNTLLCHAQNYVPNGDFETYTGLPSGPAAYALATGWTNCSGTGSPDYAHTAGSGMATLPNNYFGIISPHSGDAIMGLILWHSTNPSFREYVSHALSSPMIVGNTYLISFYVTNGISSGNYGGYGVDQVSIALSTDSLVQVNSTPISFTPQYVVPFIVIDTAWQQVSFLFTADSAYNHITFGNFKDDAGTNTQFFRNESIQAAYYFVDDFEVIDSAGSAAPSVSFSSSDSSFCGKQCIDFTDLSTNNPTSWQWFFPGADSIASNLQNPTGICYSSYGSFDVTLIACNGAGCDTLVVPAMINEYQNPPVPVITMNTDTLFSTQAFSYQWYLNSTPIPGATNQFYVFQQMGTYFVIVTDSNGCASSSSTLVLSTGINESAPGIISVYPNPSDGNFILSGATVNSEIKIYNVAGQIILYSTVIAPLMQLNLQTNEGIYLLECTSEKRVFRQKLLIFK